jgi:hypothetical protein
MQVTRRQNRRADPTAASAIGHPVRVRALEVSNERDISPIDFVRGGFVPTAEAKGRSEQAVLSMVAYHFRALLEAGCVEVVGTRRVRGAVEQTYRGRSVAYFTDAQWAELPVEVRVGISRTMYQGMVARIESAMISGTFDAQADRMLAWTPLQLDGQGWAELVTSLETCFAEVERIKVESRLRLEDSGEEAMPATFGILGFESPPAGAA